MGLSTFQRWESVVYTQFRTIVCVDIYYVSIILTLDCQCE